MTPSSPPPAEAPTPQAVTPKWISFREIPAPGVTRRWEIVANQGGAVIGWIAWANGWRRYVLQPGWNTEWEQDCLRDVAAFLEQQTAVRKMVRELAKAATNV